MRFRLTWAVLEAPGDHGARSCVMPRDTGDMKSNHVIISLAGHLVCPRTCSRLQVTDETSAFGGFGGGVNGVLLGDKDVLFSICTKLRCQHGKYTGRPCICGVLGERTN